MHGFILACSLVSAFILLFGLVSLFVKEKLYLSETLLATAIGIFYGPSVLNKINIAPSLSDDFMFQFSRLVISLQVVAVGIAVPKSYIRKEWKSLFVLLFPLMVLTWLISSGIICLVTKLSFLKSLVIGACVTPTDPVLASTVLKGKFANRYIPVHLRNLLTVESGANDGLGFPLLTLPIYLLTHSSVFEALKKWTYHTWVYEIFLAIAIGVFFGYFGRILLKASKARNLIDKESFLVFIIALAVTVTGFTALIDSDDIVAAFICGMVFSWDKSFLKDVKDSHLLDVIDLLINLSYFVLFGSILPFTDFKAEYWWCAFLIILFRRLPLFFIFRKFVPELRCNREAFFAGWYGPMGVGAIFFAYFAKQKLPDFLDLVPLVQCVVLSSVIMHGSTAPIIHVHLRKNKSNVQYVDMESNITEFESTSRVVNEHGIDI
ncbi:Na+/H+ antiporter [Hamiltosporidium tvaerminnensis]|uniref:Na+/H+ antiporter n=2 Tax=Hamiltosporidium TaxID=1176354 RepID=A0A4Q9L6F9_9MICR|nr:Na+/H+ antiporter [Hamiltosporidium tvaerminnensis]TBT99818.1 Na+/H+ antiporter [Hamiltosporidium tvaerminnensis]TBU02441.1 Na+/H+ antiporter [Hamiltosporidium magnivora]TBU03517.1 Na+/H+ antiporter [Hamiltosporidium magnivora]TBU20878.1 Na+/H+ antiporter [Hamiltosporidium tvaerminnensis]